MLPRYVLFVHVFLFFEAGLAANSGHFHEIAGRHASRNAHRTAASKTTPMSSMDPCGSGLSTSSSSSSGSISTGASSSSSIGNCTRSSFTSTSHTYPNGPWIGKHFPTRGAGVTGSKPSTSALPPGSGSLANTSSALTANASSTAVFSASTSVSNLTVPVSTTTGMLDGAPWLDPVSFCDFGSLTYPTVSLPSTITNTAKLCAYTTLNPASAITPKQTSAIPTDRPGYGGVPGCAAVAFGPAQKDCPYGTDGWCNCGGVIVPPLVPTASGLINCDITIQPTSGSCPVNTAYSSSLAAASASSAAAASRSAAAAKAAPNTVVSSFACPTDAVVGGPDGFAAGQSNQETVDDPKSRQQQMWANFNSWGCDMPKAADNDAIATALCGSIPPNTVLSLGIGNQPFWWNSSSHDADDKSCQNQFYNIAFTVKDKCEVQLTKEYCMGMYKNVKSSCPLLNPKSGAAWEGGLVTDNCGVAYFTSGFDITQLASTDHNPFFDLTNSYWWDTNHLLCGPNGLKDPTYCPAPLAKPD